MFDLDMGRYAAFVWPAWGISAAVLAVLAARAGIAARHWSGELKRLEAAANPAPAVQDPARPHP